MKDFVVIVLAAGEGTRMKSDTSKVLHQICGRPLLDYVVDRCRSLKMDKIVVVAGKNFNRLKKHLPKGIILVRQARQKGTADAVLAAKRFIVSKNILVLYGDTPLLTQAAILGLIAKHRSTQAAVTILTAKIDNPSGYGRIIRDGQGEISCIKEDRDLAPAERRINEINSGLFCFKAKDLLGVIAKIRPDNKKREYYLTDAIKLLSQQDKKIASVTVQDWFVAEGINNQEQLANFEKIMRSQIIRKLMQEGVRFIDPDNTYIDDKVKIGRNSIVYPGTYIEKDCIIGKNCRLGPCAHLRSGTRIKDNVSIGNFVEVKNSSVDNNTKISHFSYIGDARIGKNVNIGAGTVTANYDGKKKHKTIIEDNAFIGSDTVLVAPVRVGKNAVTGAGCVVPKNKNVLPNTVVMGVPSKVLKINPVRKRVQKKK
jgi:bifunctional UDP-N-acetylglucosamine pyrophosphorylase/glucosamine-1-phosphate N-acetyltransferase